MKDPARRNALASKLAKGILVQQSRMAVWLNGKTSSYSPGKWKVLLLLFCLLAGSTCIYLIITSIYN